MRGHLHKKLQFTITLARKDGSIYQLRGLTFDELQSHVEKQDAVLRKLKLGKFGPLPSIPNYRNPRIPAGSIVLINSARDTVYSGNTKIHAYLGRSFQSKTSVFLEPGVIGLILGYKYRRTVVTYFDMDIAKSSRWATIPTTRSLRFVTVSRYARVLVDDKECLIWEGNLKHIPFDKLDELTDLQTEIVERNLKRTRKKK
jgi:hypothetical protein